MTLVSAAAQPSHADGDPPREQPSDRAGDPAPPPPPDWLTAPPPPAVGSLRDTDDVTFTRPWQLLPIPIRHPHVFDAATAHILPAAVFYSGTGIDTGGNLTGIAAFGLGDVADFAVETNGTVRARAESLSSAQPILPYLTAQLRMGVDEDLLFRQQPAVALGFRKSFERETDGHKTRIAELFLVASKRLGTRTSVHAGVSLWDAFLVPVGGDAPLFLHSDGLADQIRPLFGLEIQTKPRAHIMIETFWAPEFDYERRRMDLRAKFAFGVRYALFDRALIESGVAVPDIGARDLLEAQIFTRIVFISHRLAEPYQRVK